MGPENSTLGSDLGQKNNPLPTESFREIVGKLLNRSMRESDLRKMVSENPATLVGL